MASKKNWHCFVRNSTIAWRLLACQLACQDYYQLPSRKHYMRCFLGKPDVVDSRHGDIHVAVRVPLGQVRSAWRRRGQRRARPSASRRPASAIGEMKQLAEHHRRPSGAVPLALRSPVGAVPNPAGGTDHCFAVPVQLVVTGDHSHQMR